MTSPTGLSPSMAGLSSPIWLSFAAACAVRTPMCSHMGLGSSDFARRYSRNRCFFLFLRLLRCFSSPGSLPYPMDSGMDAWSLSMRVSPFRDPWIAGYLLLPTAFRSLSRLSSALSAKASALCSFLLNLSGFPLHGLGYSLPHPPVSRFPSKLHIALWRWKALFFFFFYPVTHFFSCPCSLLLHLTFQSFTAGTVLGCRFVQPVVFQPTADIFFLDLQYSVFKVRS